MASHIQVAGNRVSVDECHYEVSPAGTDRYAVADEFGVALGYFSVRGRAVSTDDYGVEGAHPLMLIGKAWVEAVHALPPVVKPCLMVCRVATTEGATPDDVARTRAHAAWLKKQSGNKASFVTFDAATSRLRGVSVWTKAAKLEEALAAAAPDGAGDAASAQIEITALDRDL